MRLGHAIDIGNSIEAARAADRGKFVMFIAHPARVTDSG
jgi:hypothetical protein